jgi:murein DD-endopeptidase MepM/ murein hydrolase activator NlpD
MASGKTLTNLAVCLSFWIAVVLLLLTSSRLDENATATPIAAPVERLEIAAAVPAVPALDPPAPVEQPGELLTEISGELRRGESFDAAMKRVGVAGPLRAEIIRGFTRTIDFRTLQPGDRFTVALKEDSSLARAAYVAGPLHTYTLRRGDDGSYQTAIQEVTLEYRVERLGGVIDSSLYTAFTSLGEEPKLIHAYADIFASKIDFNTETRTGDSFELLLEKYYKDDVFVGYGRILAARYQNKEVTFEGFHYSSETTPGGFFDATGKALGTWFIRSPIPFGRVTSRFSLKRKHPVDGVVRPHLGVDLAAPRGTPVMATADGRIEFIGRRGGFGKTVILKHHGGYKTYYGHLSSYKKGLRKNSPVTQKDIIGYVGSTGISTGPHLDYRIQVNGVFRNPFTIKFQAKTILQGEELELFHQARSRTASLFDSDPAGKVLQVKHVTLDTGRPITFL